MSYRSLTRHSEQVITESRTYCVSKVTHEMLTQTLGNVYENDGKRSREEICFYILMEAKKYIKKSTIVYQTNLNFKVLKKHLTLLKKRLRVENYEVSSSLKSRSEECGSTWSFN